MKFRSSVSDFVNSLVSLPVDLFFPAELAKAMENAVPRLVELLKRSKPDVRGNWFSHLRGLGPPSDFFSQEFLVYMIEQNAPLLAAALMNHT